MPFSAGRATHQPASPSTEHPTPAQPTSPRFLLSLQCRATPRDIELSTPPTPVSIPARHSPDSNASSIPQSTPPPATQRLSSPADESSLPVRRPPQPAAAP